MVSFRGPGENRPGSGCARLNLECSKSLPAKIDWSRVCRNVRCRGVGSASRADGGIDGHGEQNGVDLG